MSSNSSIDRFERRGNQSGTIKELIDTLTCAASTELFLQAVNSIIITNKTANNNALYLWALRETPSGRLDSRSFKRVRDANTDFDQVPKGRWLQQQAQVWLQRQARVRQRRTPNAGTGASSN